MSVKQDAKVEDEKMSEEQEEKVEDVEAVKASEEQEEKVEDAEDVKASEEQEEKVEGAEDVKASEEQAEKVEDTEDAKASEEQEEKKEVSVRPKEDEDDRIYRVLVNREEQYAIWLADNEIPKGWESVGPTDKKDVCLAYVKEVWTDMRPKSLR